ncbi:FMR1 neighbor protein [Acomys russatus]|uniref:FMR1 neighbor protein n=1 Tax=Acomys russatus TaxID=60746 RepID=UPI0021E2A895|nr:FMR1 neighbor protein [Acomys russatus]
MPSDIRPRQGRHRSKSAALRGVRSKITTSDSGHRGENPAPRMFQGPQRSGPTINMAAVPQFGFWAAVRQCLQNMWYRRNLGLFLLLIWTLVILCYIVNTNSVSPREKLPWHGETLEHGSHGEILLNFFFPTTCIIRENQEVVACNKKAYLNKTECFRSKCCFSSSGTKMKCYAPLRDKPLQMLRVFGCSVIVMIIVGLLPMYCCSLCRRR